MSKVNKVDFTKLLRKTVELPDSAFTGVEIAKVLSVNPISIGCYGQTITSNFIYTTPFCEIFETEIFKHTHKYDDHDTGEGAGGSRSNIDTSEELKKVTVWRGLKIGDDVLVIRTNESQKYILLCRVNKLDDRG